MKINKNKQLHLHTEFTFDSAHKLEGYDGKCSNVHGHTGLVEIEFKGKESQKNSVGILIDFGIVKKLKEMLDHNYLNNVLKTNPTAENISRFIYDYLHTFIKKEYGIENILIKIKVYETAVKKHTWCQIGDW